MIKVVVEIKEKKDDAEHCNANINIKGVDKATEKEKIAGSNVYNKICEMLENI